MLEISNKIRIPEGEIEFHPIRGQGPGGQHRDKAATAVQLRFDIRASSLPEDYQARLLRLRDHRITRDGVIVIKAQSYRSQDQNRADALSRLRKLIRRVEQPAKPRRPTRPSFASRRRRLEEKKKHRQKKALRKKVW